MRLEILHLAGCAGARELEDRLRVVLAGRPGVQVRRREIRDADDAADAGMAGSPTLLVDGVDPFAGATGPGAVACRLYRDAAGRAEGAPSLERLREVLGAPSADDSGGA